MQNKFFGSKLNSILLLVLIILMVIALFIMSKNKAEYLGAFQKQVPVVDVNTKQEPLPAKEVILGNKEDLVSFSIMPGQEVSGIMKVTGILPGGYFFEGNLPVSILDENKKLTSFGPGHGQATIDSWTSGPVSFNIDFDFTKIPKGRYYIKLTPDDPSGGESGRPINSILIPITVK